MPAYRATKGPAQGHAAPPQMTGMSLLSSGVVFTPVLGDDSASTVMAIDGAQPKYRNIHNYLPSINFFKVADTVICDLDLFLHNGHAPGKAVVLPHLPRQLVQLCVRHSLRCGDFVLCAPGGRRIGNHYAHQRQQGP